MFLFQELMQRLVCRKRSIMKHHYDIGIYGWWGHENFGGCLTYYALNKSLTKMGRSVLMIQEAVGLPPRYIIPDNCIAMRFALKHYDCSPQVHLSELYKFNDKCDAFITGGDQLWNPAIPFVREDNFLNFVDENKLKLSYSTSFGNAGHYPSTEFVDTMAPLLKRFDAISVREDYAVKIAKDFYGVSAKHIIDAVFLLDAEDYVEATHDATVELPEQPYLFAFILNPTQEKRAQIEIIAKKLNLQIVCAPDAAEAYHEEFHKVFQGLDIIPLSIENFLKAYANASYVVTDSFHGTCMSHVFHKDYSVYFNQQRGADRFVSLMKLLKQDSRAIDETMTEQQLLENKEVGFTVDWSVSDANIAKERQEALEWLNTAVNIKKSQDKIPSKFNVFHGLIDPKAMRDNPDFMKIKLLASLLRDYGIKHIVLSPGGRDVPLIRMFEYNEGAFVLHRVTDERSAAYYAMGIATQLRQPVACVCTSGTAASNFLPAITEAYYTGIPLIAITADRYGVYLNQGEDQTIPQKRIFEGVVKKEISLPEAGGRQAEYQSRRDISECILESTHNGFGPVHINVPVENIAVGVNFPREYWKLLPFTHPHILRVGFNDGDAEMYKWVDSLKKSPRILIVFGQNAQLSQKEKDDIELFASKYNCVIVTDHISNLHSEFAVQPFNMLLAISQQEFDKELAPDIVISVGGKRLMNDPLTFKIRGSSKPIRHWSVMPDGKVKDFYFHCTSVIESTQKQFFRWFANRAGDISNDRIYFNKWKECVDKSSAPHVDKFNAHYIQGKFLPLIPAQSILHLGVGQSFYDCRRHKIDSSVSVYCNMGTNGIDGCTSTFLGQCVVAPQDKLCFLLVGDLSFFYDMNSIWNKPLTNNIRILMVNNNGSGLLRSHNLRAVTSVHNTVAEGWVKSTGFEYMCAHSQKEFDMLLPYFISNKSQKALFFEVFCD